MKIRFLGTHNCESQKTKLTSILIDDAIAIDAGGLTSSLTFKAQQKLKAILLTHQHYDHIRDIPAMAMNALLHKTTINVYSTQAVYDALTTHWLNGQFYPNFLEKPEGNPIIKFTLMETNQTIQVGDYSILTVPGNHSVPTVGYQVTSPDGKSVFYTGDTGPDSVDLWQGVSPQVLITEVTAPNQYEEFGRKSLHLTPSLLRRELLAFQKQKGYLPQVVLVHMIPPEEKDIEAEIAPLIEELNIPITLAYEGMQLHI